jgi:ribosome modulation factor
VAMKKHREEATSQKRESSNGDFRPSKPSGWKRFKAWRLGYKAAKSGQSLGDCPYQLDEEARKILLKRDQWIRGWEERAFRKKTKKQIRKDRKKKSKVVGKSTAYGVGYDE